jgi:hypothetical protein
MPIEIASAAADFAAATAERTAALPETRRAQNVPTIDKVDARASSDGANAQSCVRWPDARAS